MRIQSCQCTDFSSSISPINKIDNIVEFLQKQCVMKLSNITKDIIKKLTIPIVTYMTLESVQRIYTLQDKCNSGCILEKTLTYKQDNVPHRVQSNCDQSTRRKEKIGLGLLQQMLNIVFYSHHRRFTIVSFSQSFSNSKQKD